MLYNYAWFGLGSGTDLEVLIAVPDAIISRERFTATRDLYAHSHTIELEIR